jgi:hypothetical protein
LEFEVDTTLFRAGRVVQHEIIGDDMQAVILSLAAGDVVRAEAGAMMFMTGAIEMDGVRLRASAGFKIRLRPAAGVGSRKPEVGSRKPVFDKMEFCRAGRRAWRDGGSSTAVDARRPRAGRR